MSTKENFSDLINILEDETNLTYVKILFMTKSFYNSKTDKCDYTDFVSIGCCTKDTTVKESYNTEYKECQSIYHINYEKYDDYEGFCFRSTAVSINGLSFKYSNNCIQNQNKISNVYYKLSVQDYETYIKPVIDKIISKNSMVYQSMIVLPINKSDNNKQHILKSGGISDIAKSNAQTDYTETSWIMLIKPISIGVNASGIYINYQAPKSYIVHTNTPQENERFNEVKMTIINNNIIKNSYCDMPCDTMVIEPTNCYFHYETNLVKLIPLTYKNKAALSFLTEPSIPSVIEIDSQNQNAVKKTFKICVKFVKGFKAPSKIASHFDYLQMINYFETHMKNYVAVGNIIDPSKMFSPDKNKTYYLQETYILKSELPNTYLQKTDRELMIHVKKSKITIYAVSTIDNINNYAAFSISEKNLLDAYKEVLPEDQFKAMYVKYSLT